MQIRILHNKSLILTALMLFSSAPASESAETCDIYSVLRSKQPRAAVVAPEAGPRLHFQRNDVNCPSGKGCEAKAYLLPDDKVIIADDGGGWVCAFFQGPKRDTAGWLPRSPLIIDSRPPAPVQQDWIGRWRSADNVLLFDGKPGGRVFIQGWAIGVGFSFFKTEATPKENLILYKDGTCRITLRWVDGFILATNSLDCSGAGNSYYGIYRRVALTTDPKDDPPDPQGQ